MAKNKKSVKSSRKSVKRVSNTTHGLEHDFIMIVGGGFIVLVLILVTLFN